MRIWAPRLFRGSVYDPGMEQFAPQDTQPDTEPHSEIARLEARIEELALRLEGCRKYAAAALTAMGLGAVLLAAALTGVIQLDAVTVMASGAAVLGGIVLSGSNRSTTREIEAALAEAEAERAALIGSIDLRVVSERPRPH
jgi:hypothetical protein